MNELDKKIRAALAADEAELFEQLGEPSLPEQVIETFRGRGRWLVMLMFVMTTVFVGLGIATVIGFFQADTERAMIAWAAGFGFCLITIAMLKIWYWMELNKNAITREIKRVELQLARLAGPQGQANG
jgi:hypothetical protein